MWDRDSPVSVVSLHWWPRRDSDHCLHCPSVGASLGSAPTMCKPATSSPFSGCFTRLRADLFTSRDRLVHTALLSRFHACRRSHFRLHNRQSRLLGGALWRACNLTSFSPCLTGPVYYPFASRHKGPGFKTPGGYLCETGILLLACLAT
jgi:hypothetical protein